MIRTALLTLLLTIAVLLPPSQQRGCYDPASRRYRCILTQEDANNIQRQREWRLNYGK